MAIVLAAGQATRLRPLTADKPKSLLSVGGRPMVAFLLDALSRLGETRITLVVGHGERALRSFVGDGTHFGVEVTYVQQKDQLGPGHALAQARSTAHDELVLVLPADAWYHPELLKRLIQCDGPAMTSVPDARSGRHGVPVSSDGRVTDLLEQEEAGNRATAFCGGAYKVHRRLLDGIGKHHHSMRDAIRADLKANGPWHLVEARPGEYVDVVEPQDLLAVHDRVMSSLASNVVGTVEPSAHVEGPLHLGTGSTLRAGTVVRGPVFVGDDCDVGPGAVLMPGTAIRNRVRVGPLTLLARCGVASNVTIGNHTSIRDAVLDNGAQVGSHCHIQEGTGTVVGTDARLGDRVTVEGGGVIGRGAEVAPGRTVHTVPDGGHAV